MEYSLGRSRKHLGELLGLLREAWGPLGSVLASPGASREHLGDPLGTSWDILVTILFGNKILIIFLIVFTSEKPAQESRFESPKWVQNHSKSKNKNERESKAHLETFWIDFGTF